MTNSGTKHAENESASMHGMHMFHKNKVVQMHAITLLTLPPCASGACLVKNLQQMALVIILVASRCI